MHSALERGVRWEGGATGDDRGGGRGGVGQRARILTDKGEVDEALKLHREQIAVYQALGDRRERAVTLNDIALIHIGRKDLPSALPLLRESYDILLRQGDPYGIAFVGETLAYVLIKTGSPKEAEPVIESG